MRIYVTRKDIEQGMRSRGDACPIALAVNRRLGPNGWRAFVNGFWVRYGKMAALDLPPEARAFANAFDLGHEVKPAVFELSEIT